MTTKREPVKSKCNVVSGELCNGLVMHMSDSQARTRRGIMTLTLITDDGEVYGSQPAYFTADFPNGTWLNYCPWCGDSFKDWDTHAQKRVKEKEKV
jgi:hypothetical protein